MGFGSKKPVARISVDRLAAVTGGGGVEMAEAAAAAAPSPPRPVMLEPDVSRIRKNMVDEAPEERKRRLAAKTVNFSTTILARMVILAAAGFYAWNEFQFSGQVHRGVAIGLFAMTADLGRVTLKVMTPGSK